MLFCNIYNRKSQKAKKKNTKTGTIYFINFIYKIIIKTDYSTANG